MANAFFQFKQFTVRQDLCAMKVGTDGVLLGAWASVEQAQYVLDVGAGTGLIALMAAQRSTACIDAIDIDASACRQAEANCTASPFANRICVAHVAFNTFLQTTSRQYDRIVSNPPYFHDSLKSPDQKRTVARHTDSLLLEDLVCGCHRLLTPTGRLCLVLPADQEEKLLAILAENGLHRVRQTYVVPIPHAQPKRILIEIAGKPTPDLSADYLTIELERHRYTPEYIALTRDFYLNM